MNKYKQTNTNEQVQADKYKQTSTQVGNVIGQDFKTNSCTNKIRVWDCDTGFWVTWNKHKGNVCPIGRLL